MNWDDVKDAFAWDGSLRDLYVLNASPAHWTRWLQALPTWPYGVTYSIDGTRAPAPQTAEEAFAVQQAKLLSIDVEGIRMNCHFFSDDVIELDLDPREVRGPYELAALERFMRRLGVVVGLPVRMTPENASDGPIFEYAPETDAVVQGRPWP